MHIKIGTRGSKLALWQAYYIQDKLLKHGISTQIIIIETKGDKILDKALSKIGSKGVFTEELEEQLHAGTIDIAVHSAKDLQSDLGTKLSIIAYTEREKTSDVLISLQSKESLAEKKSIIIGTSSTRRVAMLKAYFPTYRIVDMRGNLQTRIKKMESGACDALMLAYAGVHRMKYDSMICHEFNITEFVPPVGQGCVAVEISNNLDMAKAAKIRELCNDPVTEQCLLTERAFLKELKGGCSIPVFGYAKLLNEKLVFEAGIISLDGKEIIHEIIMQENETSEQLGVRAAKIILDKGGKAILEKIKNQLN
jgi:hydroxymethylbilane synthase